MEGDVGRYDRWIIVVWGALLAALGLTQVGATLYFLLAGEGIDGWDLGFGILTGGYAAAIGGLLLSGRLDHKPLMLPYELWRYWLVLAIFLIGSLQLAVAGSEPWPERLREIPTLMFALGSWFLFAPFNRPDTVPSLTKAQRRTWRRSIAVLAVAGAAVLVAAVVATMVAATSWTTSLLPFGIVLALFTALAHWRFSTLLRTQADEPRRDGP